MSIAPWSVKEKEHLREWMYKLGVRRPLKARWEIQKSFKKKKKKDLNLGLCKNGKLCSVKDIINKSRNANRRRRNIFNTNCCNINWLKSLIYKDSLQIDFFF